VHTPGPYVNLDIHGLMTEQQSRPGPTNFSLSRTLSLA
jgi:hypothetical protein